MTIRATKAAGWFSCDKPGAYELLVHMEADPQVQSYREVSFEHVLTHDKATELSKMPAYLLCHSVGLFVVTARTPATRRNEAFYRAWLEADAALANQGIWLLSTTPARLRREPKWSRVVEIARCASADIDPDDQERVIEHLSRVGHAPVRDCAKLCSASADSLDALYRLVSSGVLFLDSHDAPLPAGNLRLMPDTTPPASAAVDWIEHLPDERRRRIATAAEGYW